MDFSPFWISLKTAITATLLTVFIGTYIAYKMAFYKGPGKGIIDGLLNLPLVLPPTVVGFFLLLIFGRRGILGSMLYEMGIQIVFTWWGNVIAASTVAFPLMYKTTRSAIEQVDRSYIQAAKTLGASEKRIFFKILLPLAWPGLAAGSVLAFARAMGEFGATLMIAGSIIGETRTMPIAIFFASESGNDQEALIWVFIICMLSIGMISLMNYWLEYSQKYIRE